MTVACLYFPLWPIQRLVFAEPNLRKKSVVLFQHDAKRGQVVYTASPMALEQGVFPGMPLAEARALVPGRKRNEEDSKRKNGRRDVERRDRNRLEAHPTFREADVVADRERLHALAVELHQFSPLIGLEQVEHPEALLLSLDGLAHLFGGESQWCESVRQWLTAVGWHARVAVANTIGAALALAKHTTVEASVPESLVPESLNSQALRSPHRLDPLPVDSLRLPNTICDTLAELGIQTIGQLRQLPRPNLASRFGDIPARRLDQLDGVLAETIRGVVPPENFTATMPLEHPLADRQVLCTIVQQLVSRIVAMLAARQEGALRWQVRLDRYEASSVTWWIHLFGPTTEADHLQQLVAMHIEQLKNFDTTKNPISNVEVIAQECVTIRDRQLELFDSEEACDDSSALAQLVNRLAARLGPARIVRPQVFAETQPERAVRDHPLTGSRAPSQKPRKASAAAIPQPWERPLRLLRDFVPIQVELDEVGQPCSLVIAGEPLPIATALGPERIETGWWRAPLVRRDYWRVETTSARRLWIHHDLKQNQWFWQGEG